MVEGETSSKVNSFADVDTFKVDGFFNTSFSCEIGVQYWANGDKDIVCYKASGSQLLNTIVGRLRLSIYDFENNESDWVAFKTAILKKNIPPHATLYKGDMSYYSDYLKIDIPDFLKQYGEVTYGTKEELLGEEGKSKGKTIFVVNKGKTEALIAIFILTRIFPVLFNEISK